VASGAGRAHQHYFFSRSQIITEMASPLSLKPLGRVPAKLKQNLRRSPSSS
jgi:hypothetical protein